MEVSGQLQIPAALLPGMSGLHGTHWKRGSVRSTTSLDAVAKKKKHDFSYRELSPSSPAHI
jgi:hypothetical protein